MQEPIPFKTDDAILALCLYFAGVPEAWNPTNLFDEAKLKKLGHRGELWDTAQAAWKRKDRGHVEYYFQRTPELPLLLSAYRDQEAIISAKGDDKDAGEAVRDIWRRATARDLKEGEAVMDEREANLRAICTVLKIRTHFVNRFKNEVPYLKLPKAGDVQHLSANVVRYPGFDLIPLDATDDLLRRMKLK